MKKPELKQFVVRKYIMARSAKEALAKERKVLADDVWVSEEWLKNNVVNSKPIGYK